MAKERKINLTDDDLEDFHNTLEELLQYHIKYESQAFSIISSLEEVRDSIPWNVSELIEEE